MTLDNLKDQQVKLLARKALLYDELKNIDAQITQIAAITQFVQAQPAPEPAAE